MTTSSKGLISVVVSTYNRPDALTLVLKALNVQTYKNYEVIIADDGSDQKTKKTVDILRQTLGFPLIHTWQEDLGFRAAEARNRAVASGTGEYIVFLDGDCVPFPNFLANHMRLSELGWFVRGNRIALKQAITQQVLNEESPVYDWTFPVWLKLRVSGQIKRVLPLLNICSNFFRKTKPKDWFGVKTCNLGLWKADFMSVNGFDEQYRGWGHEDADLAVRLLRKGVFRKEGRFCIPVLHLWHKLNDRSALVENELRLKAIIEATNIRAKKGINYHL